MGLLVLGPVEMLGPTASFEVRGVKIRNALALLALNLDKVAASFTFGKDIDACDMMLDDGDRTTVDLPAGGTTRSGAVVRAAAPWQYEGIADRKPRAPTHQSRRHGYGKLRRCTERDGKIADFYLYLAATFVVVRRLIQQTRTLYRWATHPTTKRLT